MLDSEASQKIEINFIEVMIVLMKFAIYLHSSLKSFFTFLNACCNLLKMPGGFEDYSCGSQTRLRA